jgi:hypothetical protein
VGVSRGYMKVIINFLWSARQWVELLQCSVAVLSGKGINDVFVLRVCLQTMFCP